MKSNEFLEMIVDNDLWLSKIRGEIILTESGNNVLFLRYEKGAYTILWPPSGKILLENGGSPDAKNVIRKLYAV